MDDETRVVNGIIVEEYLITTFLLALTKRMNGPQANMVLDILGSGDIDLFDLLGGDVVSKEKNEKLKKLVEYHEKETRRKQRVVDDLRKSKRDLQESNRTLSNDMQNYISAIRYYEDTLESMGIRRDILKREDLGKIFDEEDEEDGWG
jgi:uncharacterized membrane-anchored protein